MARLKYAPNLKLQDQTGNSEIVICVGVQAWDFAKYIKEQESPHISPVVVDNEILEEIDKYRIAPKKARFIRLIRTNNAKPLDELVLGQLCANLAGTTKAIMVELYDEAGQLIDNLNGYVGKIRKGESALPPTTESEDYATTFNTKPDNKRVSDFLAWYNKPLRLEEVSDTLYTYTGKKWEALTEKAVGRIVRDFFKEKGISYSARRIDGMVKLMIDYELELMGKRNSDLLAFSNGVLNKKTGEFLPHDEQYFLTSFIDIQYAEQPQNTPHFDRWLQWVSDNDQSKARRILAGLYMILTNRYEWQLFLEVTGVGGSGKSIFNELAKMLAGEGNTAAISLKELESVTARAKLIDKTFFYSSDQESYIGDGAELRAITGGDSISVKLLYKNPFDVVVRAVYMMTNNTSIIFKENNGGIMRRRVIFHFNRKVPDDMRDNHLKEKLNAEASGIVRRLLDTFSDPSEAEKLLHEQRESMEALKVRRQTDHILDFCRHFTSKQTINGLYVGSARTAANAEKRYLYSAYLHYCECLNITKPLGRNRFIQAFKQAMKESQFAYEFEQRSKDGYLITNVYFIDSDSSLNEWRG